MITPERMEIRELAFDFARGELRPHAAERERAGVLSVELVEQLGELGFWGMRVPEEHGGLGFDAVTFVLALEALAWGDASLATVVGLHAGPVTEGIARFGSPEQAERWLPGLASGSVLGTLAAAEDDPGRVDPERIQARAVADGGGWRLSGTKRWVMVPERAGLFLTLARTEGGGDGEVAAFLVPAEAPGVEAARGTERPMGLAAAGTGRVELDEARVPAEARIEGDGAHVAARCLAAGHLAVAAVAVGIGQAALEHALDYADERTQFGAPIRKFGAIRDKLARMATAVAGARSLVADAAEAFDGRPAVGLPSGLEARAAMARVHASEAAVWVADEAVQTYGGYGYIRDYPVERLLRDAKGTELCCGTNDELRMTVARAAVRERLDVD